MAEFDDKITEGYEDDEPEALSADEQEKRLNVFMQDVENRRLMLRKPKNYPPKERVQAAYWLGEAGDPTAIPELVLVYKKDKTPGMKEAAAYALGMFKALEDALDDPELQDETQDRLEDIVLQGAFGKRADPARFRPIQIGLGISFVILLVLSGILMLAKRETPEDRAFRETQESIQATEDFLKTPSPTPDTEEAVVEALRTYYTALSEDARVLQGQMSLVTRGESQDCTVSFANPPVYTLSTAHQGNAGFVQIVDQLNSLRNDIIPVRDAFLAACTANTAIPREDGLSYGGTVITAQRTLTEIGALFTESGLEAPPTAELTATPTPTEAPQATADVSAARNHIDALQFIVNDMISFNGKANNLVGWWQQVLSDPNGRSAGCLDAEPDIRAEDYDVPDQLAAEFPDLAAAEENVNLGLTLMRQSVAAFYAGCASSDVQAFKQQAQGSGITSAQTAVQAFTDAQTNLDALGR